jgi:histidine triad (HIT) family protein
MKKCVFCSIIKNNKPFHQIVWQDKNHLAFLDAFSPLDGHLQVIPKKHVNYLLDLDDREYVVLFRAVKKVAALLKKTFKCKRVGLAVEGFSVPHAHIHLVPLNSSTAFQTDNRGQGRRSPEDLLRIANRIRKNI